MYRDGWVILPTGQVWQNSIVDHFLFSQSTTAEHIMLALKVVITHDSECMELLKDAELPENILQLREPIAAIPPTGSHKWKGSRDISTATKLRCTPPEARRQSESCSKDN